MKISFEQNIITPYLCALMVVSLFFLQACSPNEDLTNYPERVEQLLEQNTPQTAIILLKNVLRAEPKDSVARMKLGQIYLSTGDIVSAKKELKRAYELDPQNVEVVISYAEALYFSTKFKDINQLLEEHESWKDNFKLKAYSILAEVDIYHGYLEQAEEIISQAIKINKNSPEILFTQAYLKNQTLKFDEADKLLDKLLAVSPQHYRGLLLKGDIELKNNNYEQGIAFFKKADEIYRVDSLTKIKLSQALIAFDKFDQAKTILLDILAKAKDDPYINYLLAIVEFNQKNYTKAAQYADTTLMYSEKHPESLYISAASYFSTARYEMSILNIKKFLSIYPTDIQALKLKAAVELKLGLSAEAVSTLSQLQSDTFNNKDSELLVAAGLASLKSGKYSFSKIFLQQAKALDNEDKQVEDALTLISLMQNDVSSTLASLSKAANYIPESQGDHLTLIMSHVSNKQFDLAIEYAKRYTLSYPDSPHGETLKGLAYLTSKDLSNAQDSFRSALSIKVDDPNANQNLAKLLQFQLNENNEARQLHKNVLKGHPDNLTSLLELFYIDQNKTEEQAISWLNKAIKAHPNELYPNYLLAQYYLKNNQPKVTLQIIEKLNPSHSKDKRILALSGEAFRLTRQYIKAIEMFEQLSLTTPEDPYPYYKLAIIYNNSNQLSLANKAIDVALLKSPNQTKAMLLKGQISFSINDYQTAQKMVNKIHKLVPNNSFVSELEAKIAMATGKPAKAITMFQEVLKYKETNYINVQLASALWQNNQQQQAFNVLTSWLSKYPDDSLTINALANFYILGQQYVNAINQYNIILQKSPNNILAQNNMAWLLLQEKKLNQALSHIKLADQLSPNNFNILETYGTILFESGDYQNAKQKFTDALAINPNSLDIEFNLAQVIYKTGDLQQAQAILEKLLSKENQGSPFNNKALAENLLNKIKA